MDPIALLEKYYPPGSDAHTILLCHSRRVTEKTLTVADNLPPRFKVDRTFLAEAAMLHDIGILRTNAPKLGCHGSLPYLAHTIAGRKILEAEGYPRHALVCERHVGVGLSATEIRAEKLPLPERDMLPLSLEEQIVTYADLFFSKNPKENDVERPVEKVRRTLAHYGEEKVAVFDTWHALFHAPFASERDKAC